MPLQSKKAANHSLCSMTGYGRGESFTSLCRVIVELRTVNGRFLEVRTKLPRPALPLESKIREKIASFLTRGVVDLNVSLQPAHTTLGDSIDENLAIAYARGIERLAEKIGTSSGISAMALLRLPGVLSGDEASVLKAEDISAPLLDALAQALDALVIMRKEEATRLKAALTRELDVLDAHLKILRNERLSINERHLTRIKTRLLDFEKKSQLKLDDTRLHQEVVFYVDRSDVTEEIDRLHSHFSQVREAMNAISQESVGKRLDFLIQEMSRETNTIGAKSDLLEVTKLVIEMKASIERLREQAQNFE